MAVKTRIVNGDLCETYSDENFKLLQEETGIVYGSSVVDVNEGFDDEGNPYSRFTYYETDELDVSLDGVDEVESNEDVEPIEE